MFPFIESNCHCINWICSFQALSTTALLRSKANWWLGSQLVQQRFRCNCLSKWLWRYADSGTFKGAEVLFLNMASYNIVHQHGNGFEHEIGNISVPWLALDNIGEVSKKHDKKSLYSSCMGWYWIQWCRAKALTFDGAEAVSAEPQVTVLVSMVVFVFVVCHLVQWRFWTGVLSGVNFSNSQTSQ